MKEESRKKTSPEKKLVSLRCGHLTMPCEKLDNLVQKFLFAIAAAKAITKRYLLLEKDNLVLGILWAKSLSMRMGFVRRCCCCSKRSRVEIYATYGESS